MFATRHPSLTIRHAVATAFMLSALLRPGVALAQQKVSIGVVQSLTDLTFYIAEERGFFAQEGIVPELVKFASGTQMVAPLAQGDLNVASGSVSAALFNATTRGIPIKLVADKGSMKPGHGFMPLMVRSDLVKSGAVKTMADLKGRKIASSAKGGQADVALHRALQRVGLSFSDIEPLYMGHTQLVMALQNGSIDAALATEPDATISEATGGSVRFMAGDELYPNEQVAVLMYSPAFVTGSRDTGVRFMRAYLRAARVYNDALVDGRIAGPGASDLLALLARKSEITDTALLTRMSAFGLDPDGALNIAGLRDDLALYKQWGLIEGNPAVDDIVDASFAQAARASLPAYVKATQAKRD